MFSLNHFFPKGEKFFTLLEEAAQESIDSVHDLAAFMEAPAASRQLEILSGHRDRETKIARQISEQLVTTFVTELDRDDIEALADALYKIPKTVELFAKYVIAAGSHLRDLDFSRQIKLMLKAVETIHAMTCELRHLRHLEHAQTLHKKLRRLDTEAEDNRMELLGDLYSGHYDPIRALAIHDLYKLCEKIMNRCSSVGGILMHIFLKNN